MPRPNASWQRKLDSQCRQGFTVPAVCVICCHDNAAEKQPQTSVAHVSKHVVLLVHLQVGEVALLIGVKLG